MPEEVVSEVSDSGPHSLLVLPQQKRHSMGDEAPSCVSVASTPTPSSSASAGALIWDWTLGSQHSSSAGSLVPSVRALSSSVPDHSHVSLQLSKHSSFDFEDSLGILTPDQMADFPNSCHTEITLPKTPSTDDIPFLLQDLDYDKENELRHPSKRSSMEINFEDTLVATSVSSTISAQSQPSHFDTITVTTRQGCLEENKYTNEIIMKDAPVFKESDVKVELMEQETIKDLSEDTEMSESNQSKKTSAMSVSYEPETVSNSDNMDYLRINRTPSLEDLPMDKHDLQAGPSKHVVPPPTSFVTSVTSIASLDNGYQGDGEWSRPASRGADHSPLAGKVTATLDPMTDSDFFTESDADMHDETSGQAGSGTGRGDRKAQVIDGTLYGGVSGSAHQPPGSQGNPRCPTFTPNNEEMDSSGIYSDLERKPEDPISDGGKPGENQTDETNENEKDFSPEGSTRTGSSLRSDMSQTLISPAAFTTLLMEQVNTIRNLAVSVQVEGNDISGAMEDDVFINDNSTAEIVDVLSEKTVVEVKEPVVKKREEGVKKFKMPKRNVVSKIKTMITSNSTNKKEEDENQENRRPGRTQRKNGRWDAVMNKIAQGKEEEKTKPSRLKEVKSKVFAGITNVTPPVVSPSQRTSVLQQASRQLSARGQSMSTRSLRDMSSLKSKSRRSRPRGSECSLPTGQSPTSQPSSRNSSLSDVSLTKVSPQSLRSKKRDGVRSSSPQSDASVTAPAAPGRPQVNTLPSRLLPPQKNGSTVGLGVPELKGSPVRKTAQRRPVTAPAKPASLRDLNRVSNVSAPKGEVVTRPPPLAPQPQVRLEAANKELRHAAQGVEALGVLLNYLVYNLDAFSTPQLKKDLDKMRGDWLNTKLQMEEMRMSYMRSEEEKTVCQHRLEELQSTLQTQSQTHTEQVLSMNKSHQERIQEMEYKMNNRMEEVQRLHAEEVRLLKEEYQRATVKAEAAATERLAQTEREFTERLVAAQAEYDNIKERNQKLLEADKAGRYKVLQDEVASLRVVLELRSSELQELRRSSELALRDAQELPAALQRVSALQARVEDLEDKLARKTTVEQALAAEKANMEMKVQHEDKRNKRLSQYNEELKWKLKQSSEVFALIAADKQTPKAIQLLSNLTTPKHCHKDSYLRNGVSKDAQDQPESETPKVKGVVEKNESVSWVVDLEESPTNMMNRIVRRAHSMRAVQSATPSPAHQCRTLPNPHKRQRSRTTCISNSHKPQRTRSFSFDSDSSEVPRKLHAEWGGEFSPRRDSESPPSQSGSQIDDMEDLIVVETVGEDTLSFLNLEHHIDREKLEVMGGEDFASPKLSSSSGGSDLSVRSRRSDQKVIESDEILMINRVDGLTSCLPKESAGEAMISEETSDNDSGTRDSDEEGERYCSDEESLSGSASELLERRQNFLIEHKIKMDLKHQSLVAKKVTELAPGSDSGSLSAATTAMDLSWSEDVDLLPSESEG